VARETLKDFLRKNPAEAVDGTGRIVYAIDDQGDNTAEPYIDDLTKPLKETLGNYASGITRTANRYSLSPKSSEFTLRGPDPSSPAAYDAGSGGSNTAFFQQNTDSEIDDGDLRSYFDTISGGTTPDSKGGGTFDTNQIKDVLDKSGVDLDKSGNTTLRDAYDKELISPVLTQNNRFHPDGKSPYNSSKSPMTAAEVDNLPFASKQNTLGVYDENSTAVKLKELKDIGDKLTSAATGHDPGMSGFLQALLPSFQQLGAVKLDPNSILASNQKNLGFGGGNSKTKGSSVTKVYSGFRDKSWGALNSPLEPFGATPKMGMTTLSIALALAVGILVDIVKEIIGMLMLPLPSSAKVMELYTQDMMPGGLKPGISMETPSGLISPAFFGIRPVKGDFTENVALGVDILFGDIDAFSKGGGGLLDMLSGGKNIGDSPGYFNILFRAVIRSTIEIGLAIGDIFGGGLFAAMGAIADLFETIRNSKLVGYMNMTAGLGSIYEEILADHDATKVIKSMSKDHDGVIGTKVSTTDAIDLKQGNQEYRVGKSRYGIDGNDSTLVWRQGAVPSAYLISTAVVQMKAEAGQATVNPNLLTDGWYMKEFEALGPKGVISPTSRLPAETVKAVEDAIEGEYMPFYFHDLRTNEIIAFHAFLATMSDSFTANYDSNHGYGRADPVMVYNNTTRTIGFSFHIVATNDEDFDEMWWKINALTNMCYPQYSSGNVVSEASINDGKPFTAPFSQIISASPMIRLRLGDVWKSNYSRFGLSRLFGTDQMEDFDPGSADASLASAVAAIKQNGHLDGKTVSKSGEAPLIGTPTTEWTTKREVAMYSKKDDKKKFRKVLVPPGLKLKVKSSDITVESIMKFLETGDMADISNFGTATVDVYGPTDDNTYTGFVDRITDKVDEFKYATWVAGLKLRGIEKDSLQIPFFMLDKRGIFHLDPTTPTAPAEDTAPATDAVTFMSPDTNPVTKAFESTRGRGLAGFITQLDYQFLENNTWSTSSGAKGPKSCVVTITFSPIHDIGPGMDHNGMNRAPVYNVGRDVRSLGKDPWGTE
jgi:hypothetical protein